MKHVWKGDSIFQKNLFQLHRRSVADGSCTVPVAFFTLIFYSFFTPF